ncbi:hypothetical protein M407DRAFT_221933 [Tulasnella calospora MUT 4182]|uniref:Phytase-like domain-containing protein n=1 Tax=Tulasnella calospora MUT 4182 TaxID=1051891 RepID=A0A0C3LEN3_9AGAM|nr:hypothetical protein M407DRAFT_221933 [Tulasnella calospora MUT 4182]
MLATVGLSILLFGSSPALSRSTDPVNKGLVAFGYIPANARDSTGDTLGGIGSAIALKAGSFAKAKNGTFKGTLVVQPDRGYNVDETVDYQGRQHYVNFVLKPYYGSAPLSFADAAKTLQLLYKKTILYKERKGKATTGLDPVSVRPASGGDPILPIPNVKTKNQVSLDCEGLVLNRDGSFWVSDEYGPYIYHFSEKGSLVDVIQPPPAAIPRIGGAVNFTSEVDPDSGRAPNQGFEGLTVSPDGHKLYAMLQSSTMQDGGTDDTTSRHTRLFVYDVKRVPKLIGEYVVPLPQTAKKQKTLAQSDIHYLDGHKFLVLSRDGHGNGDDESQSDYKSVDIFDISGATDIHGTQYDNSTAVSPGGVLAANVVPATYTPFVSLIDSSQLGRMGLHNGGDFDQQLIAGKWEGTALASCQDPKYPDDYFLFVGADNDFNTLDGTMVGQPYSTSYGKDVDNQFLVYRVTLPMVPRGSIH